MDIGSKLFILKYNPKASKIKIIFTFKLKTIQIVSYHKSSTRKKCLIISEKSLSATIQNPEAIKINKL